MNEQTYTYQDDEYNLDQAYYYALLILVEGNTFSYAVAYKNKLMALQTNCAVNELNKPKQLYDLLTATYKKIVIGLPSPGFSLVPSSIFNAGHIADFARLLAVKENESVLAEMLDEKNMVVYKADEKIITAASRYNIKNAVFAGKGYIKAVAQNNPLNNELYLNMGKSKIDLLYFKHGNVRLFNSFEFNSPADISYYTALVADELELQPQFITLVVSGSINAGDKTHTNLSEFFPDIVINKLSPLHLSERIAPHQFLSLSGLLLCESSEGL